MITKIHDTKNVPGGNKGSCANLVEYLEKENQELGALEEEGFFNQYAENISGKKVESMIDSNKQKLTAGDAKFFMLTVNPSQDEIKHIGSDEAKLKSYVNDLMDEYAKNFNRHYPDGRQLTGKDIMYFAKVEHERTYKYSSDFKLRDVMKENAKIKNQIIANPEKKTELERLYVRNANGTPILEGAKKDGNNLHVHIIVSRKDYQQKFKLSPLANQRSGQGVVNGKKIASKGFDRDAFVEKGEKLFDKKFGYQRNIKDSYNYKKNHGIILGATNPKAYVKMLAKKAISEQIQDKTLQKAVGMAVSDPRKMPRKTVAKLEKAAVKAILEAAGKGAYVEPTSALIQIAKKAITATAKAMSRAASI